MKQLSIKDVDKTVYKKYAFEKDMMYIRPVILLSGFLYGLFGLMDYLYYPDYLNLFFIIRYAVTIPAFLIVFALSFHKSFHKFYQYSLLAIFIIGSLGIVLMIHVIEGKNYYFGGLYLVFSIAFFLLRLRTRYAITGVVVTLISFVAIGILFDTMELIALIAHSIFYTGFVIIGIFGIRYHEQYLLNQFYQESIILGENVVLERKVFQQYENIKNYHSATIIAIARLAESRDEFTGGHINRVGTLSHLLASKLPKDIFQKNFHTKDEFVEAINLASSLHDIGKISISDLILNKPGKLNEEEFEIIKTHSMIGHNMLRSIQEEFEDNIFLSLGISISKSHHERWDGNGYPEGLKKNEIPLEARIVSLIDVYDALISERPYKKPFTKSKSLDLIREGIGTQFDPEIAKIFIKLVEKSNDEMLFGR
jgi:HD-GYP domain-containing protein (c-di-GMP phosphodiesterase class II)